MKPLIDTYNYEAYYLDYLEGNLDAETAALLEAFLAEHPELMVDDEFPVLQSEELLDETFKMSLKQQETDPITADNIEYFLIAELEGQLSEKQQSELNAFMAFNPKFEDDRKLLRSSVLVPEEVIYEHKESLKKGARIIPLWVKVAAASVVVLLFSVPFIRFSSTSLTTPPQMANVDSVAIEPNEVVPSQDSQTNNAQTNDGSKQVHSNGHSGKQSPSVSTSPVKGTPKVQKVTPRVREIHVADLPAKHIGTNAPQLAVSKSVVQQPVAVVEEVHESKMENPIPVITRSVSEVFNTPVDVKTEKSSNKRGRGFYVRIGNVEVSRSASL